MPVKSLNLIDCINIDRIIIKKIKYILEKENIGLFRLVFLLTSFQGLVIFIMNKPSRKEYVKVL